MFPLYRQPSVVNILHVQHNNLPRWRYQYYQANCLSHLPLLRAFIKEPKMLSQPVPKHPPTPHRPHVNIQHNLHQSAHRAPVIYSGSPSTTITSNSSSQPAAMHPITAYYVACTKMCHQYSPKHC